MNYYISANQSNGFRHTLKCFTELRTKQVIQTIPSLELCCGSADPLSGWILSYVSGSAFYRIPIESIFCLSHFIYTYFFQTGITALPTAWLLKDVVVSVDLTFVFCFHVQTSAAKLIKTHSSLWDSKYNHLIILSTIPIVIVSVQNWQFCTSE